MLKGTLEINYSKHLLLKKRFHVLCDRVTNLPKVIEVIFIMPQFILLLGFLFSPRFLFWAI